MDDVPAELLDPWTTAGERAGGRLGAAARELDAGRTATTGGLLRSRQ